MTNIASKREFDKLEINNSLQRIVDGLEEEECIENKYSSEFHSYIKAHTKYKAFDDLINHLDELQKELNIHNSFVLDVGCGWGIHAIILAHYNNSVIGVDIHPTRLPVAKKITSLFAEYQIDIEKSDSSQLNYSCSTFDVVYCCEFVSHVYDIESTLNEFRRVLKKDGKVVIVDTTKNNLRYLKLRYLTLPREYKNMFREQRKKLLKEYAMLFNLKLSEVDYERIARKTRGWSWKELKEMLEMYKDGKGSLRKLISMHKARFPFLRPEPGFVMYEERCFSPCEMTQMLENAGFSTVYRAREYKPKIINLMDTLRFFKFYWEKFKGNYEPTYVIVGVK